MAKKKGRKLSKKEFLDWLKKDPEKKKKKKKKKKEPAPLPDWFFLAPPERYPDPIMRPPDGWPAEHIRRAGEPMSPWLGSPSLNEHLAHPRVAPLKGA